MANVAVNVKSPCSTKVPVPAEYRRVMLTEAEASVQEVEAVEEAGEEGLDEAGESDSSDWSLPSLYKPPSPTGLNTL